MPTKITLEPDNFNGSIQMDAPTPKPIKTNLVKLASQRSDLVNQISALDANYSKNRQEKIAQIAVLDQQIADFKAAGALETAPIATPVVADPIN